MYSIIRLLLILAIAWLAWRLIKGALAARRHPTPSKDKTIPGERIVPCAHCALHIPEREAVMVDGKPYCCPEHARAARRAP